MAMECLLVNCRTYSSALMTARIGSITIEDSLNKPGQKEPHGFREFTGLVSDKLPLMT